MSIGGRISAAAAIVLVTATPTLAQDVQLVGGTARDELSAGTSLTQPAKLVVEDVPLASALAGIRRASGVQLVFSPSLLPDHHVSCFCEDRTVAEALNHVLAGTGFRYFKVGRQILIDLPSHARTPDKPAVAAPAPARQGSVTGRITDGGTGAPIVSAQVHIAELNVGVLSQANGQYQLNDVPAGRHELRVEQIGYQTHVGEVVVTDGETTVYDVDMRQEAVALDELLVTGTAGRTERKAQGALIASVPAVDIVQQAPVTEVAHILQGRIAGVSMTKGSGVSGTGQQIRIRGLASISISNEPLVYIDGVRADSRIGEGDVSRLIDLDPSQIESIEVVKGPAAATLYGADASAGVIQILTKRGAVGAGFRHTLEAQFQSLEPGIDSWTNWGRCGDAHVDDPDLTRCYGQEPGTVVTDDPIGRFGVVRTGQVRSGAWTMEGGGEGYRAFTSLGWHEEEGTLPNNEFTRTSGRVNFSYFPAENIEIGTKLSVSRTQTSLPTTGGSGFGYTIAMFAGSPITIGGPQNGLRHPYLDFDAIGQIDHEQTVTRVVPALSVRYSPTSWFTNRLILGADASEMQRHVFYPRNDVGYYQRGRDEGEISEWRNIFRRFTLNYLGSFTHELGANWGSILSVGTEVLAESDDNTFAYGIGLTTNSANAVTSAAEVTGAQERSADRRIGLFAQWEPSYQDRLFFQLGARVDKFSAFGTDVDWFISPSVRVSYVATDEPRLRDLLPEAVSSLRLRGAFGTTGRAPTSGAALTTFEPAPFVRDDGTAGSGMTPLNPGNAQLRAEKGREFEGGFDLGLLNDRIGLEYTYFHKTTTDLILQVPQAPSLGFSDLPYQNIGKVRNSGHELTLRALLIDGERFSWDVRTALNTLDNEVLDLGNVAPFGSIRFAGTNRVAEGFPVGAFFTHRIRSFDVENNRAIVSDTLEYLGNLLPSFEGNLSSTIQLPWNLSLYAHFDWKQDVMLYNTTAAFRDHSYANSEYAAQRDQIPAEERLRRFGPFVSESGEEVNRALVLETYIEPADFVRLNEVSLSFDVPSRWLPGGTNNRTMLQVGARNLHVWTDFTGLDPDVQNEFDAVAGRADFGSFPSGKRYSVRLVVGF